MKVAQKPNQGRSFEIRADLCGSDIAVEAIAQAQRQMEYIRARKDFIIKNAREELVQCEHQLEVLAKHMAEMRELSREYTQLREKVA